MWVFFCLPASGQNIQDDDHVTSFAVSGVGFHWPHSQNQTGYGVRICTKELVHLGVRVCFLFFFIAISTLAVSLNNMFSKLVLLLLLTDGVWNQFFRIVAIVLILLLLSLYVQNTDEKKMHGQRCTLDKLFAVTKNASIRICEHPGFEAQFLKRILPCIFVDWLLTYQVEVLYWLLSLMRDLIGKNFLAKENSRS